MGKLWGTNCQPLKKFRVLHLRPLGQLSVYVIPHFFQKLLERTDGKNNKIFNFRTEQKLSVYGETVGNKLPTSQKISSAAPSTTRTTLRVCDSVQFKKLFARTDGKNNKIFNFRTGENPVFMGFFSGANSQLYKKIRVSSVMTTSMPLQIIQNTIILYL